MSDSSLKSSIQDEMKAAMKAKAKERLGVIRMIMAAIKQREVDERIELTDEDVLVILDKMVKQRKESATQYREGDREDLAVVEEAEAEVIREFLPQPLTDEEVGTLIEVAIKDSGAASMRDMGKVMAILKPQIQGRADMGAVSAQVKNALNSD